MPGAPRVLVVAATPFELRWAEEAAVLACGVGPVEAAVATARRLAAGDVDVVLHVGIAGARRASGIPQGALVLGERSVYEDLAARFKGLVRELEPDPPLLARARVVVPEARLVAIGTSAAVAGSAACPVEAMEGFAVLRAAALAGVPAIELRVISNEIEETDRGRWDIPGALAILAEGGGRLLAALSR